KGIYTDLFKAVRKLGYQRVRIDGKVVNVSPVPSLARYKEHDIDIVIAQTEAARRNGAPLGEHITAALRLGHGTVVVRTGAGEERIYSERLYCGACGVGY